MIRWHSSRSELRSNRNEPLRTIFITYVEPNPKWGYRGTEVGRDPTRGECGIKLIMRLPAKTRAFWSRAEYCRGCQQHRPWFFFHQKFRTGGLCKICYRKRTKQRVAQHRKNLKNPRLSEIRAKDLARSAQEDVAYRRCRQYFGKLRIRKPKSVPRWVTIESLLPIYVYAAQLEEEDPGHKYVVSHVYPIANSREVCGLHTIDNLRIIRKKNAKGSSPSGPS